MTTELPQPMSLWRLKSSGIVLQVIISEEEGIVCHNCGDPRAVASDRCLSLLSWSGDAEEFYEDFEPL